MKNLLLTIATVGAMALTSCSSDEPVVDSNGQGNGNMTFSVEIPGEVQSRTFSDGTTATDVKCYVYDNEKDSYLFSQDVTMTGLTGSVTLNLAVGHTYDFVFLATSGETSLIEYEPATRLLNVKYADGIEANNEKLDAFYATAKEVKVSQTSSEKNITLKRPFAQLNIGTDDITEYEAALSSEAAKVKISKTAVLVEKVYSSFDLKTGEVSGEPANVTFAAAARPTETFPLTAADGEEQCQYLAMNYLLVPNDESLVNVTMTVTTDDNKSAERKFSNIPVRRNYRTNIYGTLLTTTLKYNVNIAPEYKAPSYDVEYRPVRGLTELKAALEEHAPNIKLINDVTCTNGITFDYPVTIDLNHKTITKSIGFPGALNCNSDVTLKNGTIAISGAPTGVPANLSVADNATVTLDHITVNDEKGGSIIVSAGGKIVAKECDMTSPKTYCISTNASGATKDTKPLTIELNNCTLSGNSPIMLNVPGTLTINKCTINGIMHGVIVRGGTATIINSEITAVYDGDETQTQQMANYFNTRNWGSGNTVNLAAITMGNKDAAGSTSYQYPTNVTLTNTKLSTGKWGSIIPAVYAYGMDGALGVTFTYDSRSTFNGDQNGILTYDGNVTVNGTKVTTP